MLVFDGLLSGWASRVASAPQVVVPGLVVRLEGVGVIAQSVIGFLTCPWHFAIHGPGGHSSDHVAALLVHGRLVSKTEMLSPQSLDHVLDLTRVISPFLWHDSQVK